MNDDSKDVPIEAAEDVEACAKPDDGNDEDLLGERQTLVQQPSQPVDMMELDSVYHIESEGESSFSGSLRRDGESLSASYSPAFLSKE